MVELWSVNIFMESKYCPIIRKFKMKSEIWLWKVKYLLKEYFFSWLPHDIIIKKLESYKIAMASFRWSKNTK